MKLLLFVFITCFLHKPLASPHSFVNNKNVPNDTLLRLSKEFLLSKEKAYQQKATEKDVERVLNFCSDSVNYHHILSPEKKFSFSGKDLWKAGMIAHLGETKNAKIRILNFMQRQNVVIIEFELSREVQGKNGWEKSFVTTVSVIEFDSNGKIVKLTDYL